MESGHYRINSCYSARDTISVQRILEVCEDQHTKQNFGKQTDIEHKKTVYDKIIEAFNREIQDIDAIIIGIDFVGMIIAAKLATISQKPFSYMISEKNLVYYGRYDKEVEIEDSPVIILTDVIVTGETVNNIIKQLNEIGVKENRIEKILTIFSRRVIKNSNVKKMKIENHLEELEDKIVSLNNSIDIELCLKERCIFKENNINLCECKRI